MVEALLLGLVAFIAQSEYALGTSLISRPIVTGLLTGLVLGDVQDRRHYGRDAGAGVYRLFLRWRLDPARRRDRRYSRRGVRHYLWRRHRNGVAAWPAYRHADFDPEKYLSGMFIPMLSQRADGYAERADLRGIERMHLIAGFGLSLMLAAVVTVSFLVGSNAVKSLLDTIPEFIKHGLSVATGIIPALGFAMLARLLINKKVAPYFFLGFVLMAYLKIPVTGIAILGAIVAVVMVNVTALNSPRITTEQGVSDDDEDDF